MLLVGCQRYKRSPVDVERHRAAFLERAAGSAEVKAFADRLTSDGVGDASVFDPTDGVSCAEAEIIALVYNADLRVARLRAGVTLAAADNAGKWEDPTIGVDLVRIVQSTPEPWKVFSNLGLTLPISGRLQIEKQRAGAEHGAELARVVQTEWATRMAVRRAYVEWVASDERRRLLIALIEQMSPFVDIVDMLERTGEMARIESRLIGIERATRRAELVELESQERRARLRLVRLMGLSPSADIDLQLQWSGVAFDQEAVTDVSVSHDQIESGTPAVAVAMAEYEAAEKELELEIRRQYPDLHVGPGYGREDGQDQVLLDLSVPIPILNGNAQGIATAKARREAARAGVETALERQIGVLAEAQERVRSAVNRREAMERDIVPLVDAQGADTRELARLGEVNTLVMLESLTRQHQVKASLVEARREEALAAIDMHEVIGPREQRNASGEHKNSDSLKEAGR
jgi:outer membrane protein TolC